MAKRRRLLIQVSAFVLGCLLFLGLLEVVSQILYAFKDDIKRSKLVERLVGFEETLDVYEIPSDKAGFHWTLRPGFAIDAEKLGYVKAQGGKPFGAEAFNADAGSADSNGKIFRINEKGFRGAGLQENHDAVRVLMIGDSVTFGLAKTTYPKVVSEILSKMGQNIEVINGGVEGYSAKNVLLELPHYLSIKPDVVTIMIGWNDIYFESQWSRSVVNKLGIVWAANLILDKCRRIFATSSQQMAMMHVQRDKINKQDPDIADALAYQHRSLKEVGRIVEALQKSGSKVVILTLAGLYVEDEEPSDRALEIGHLPHHTANPYVLASLVKAYNKGLQSIAKETGAELIDTASWARNNLRPIAPFFSDTVHLSTLGLQKLGSYIAHELVPLLRHHKNRNEN